jgi:hypothetical protein
MQVALHVEQEGAEGFDLPGEDATPIGTPMQGPERNEMPEHGLHVLGGRDALLPIVRVAEAAIRL